MNIRKHILSMIGLVVLGAAVLDAGEVRAETSKEAYDAVIEKIKAMPRPTTQDELQRLVDQATGLFDEFLTQYEGTTEAADIHLEYGVLMVNIGRYAEAEQHLKAFIDGNVDDPRRIPMALVFLTQAYTNQEKFDEAKPYLERIVKDYEGTPFAMQASMTLEDIGTLERLSVGRRPIPFEVVGIDGDQISPDMYKGKVVLLDFWATWCGPCIKELPNLKQTYERFNGQGFEIIGISLDRKLSTLRNFIERENMTWVQFCDEKYWESELSTLYAVRSIPMTYLLDRNGVIRYKNLRGHSLNEAVEELINE